MNRPCPPGKRFLFPVLFPPVKVLPSGGVGDDCALDSHFEREDFEPARVSRTISKASWIDPKVSVIEFARNGPAKFSRQSAGRIRITRKHYWVNVGFFCAALSLTARLAAMVSYVIRVT